MKIQELYEICKKAVEDGHGENEVYFDSCAQAFDVHYVEISSAYVEPLEDDRLILNFEFEKGVIR